MRLELARLHHDLNATMIYVTHDQVEAMTLADKVVVLNQGRIEQVGTPLDLYRNPANRFVAGFLGMPKMSFLPGTVTALDQSSVTVELTSGTSVTLPAASEHLRQGSAVTVGVRPENIDVVEPSESSLTGYLGSDTYCYVKTDGQETLTVRMPGNFACNYGDRIGLHLHVDECHLFDEQGNAVQKPSRLAA